MQSVRLLALMEFADLVPITSTRSWRLVPTEYPDPRFNRLTSSYFHPYKTLNNLKKTLHFLYF